MLFALLTLTFSLAILTCLQAQEKDVEPGIIRVKVTEQLAAQLENAPLTQSLRGTVETGISSLDVFNQQYNVTTMKRVFRMS